MTELQARVVATLRTPGPQTPRQIARHLGWGTERIERLIRRCEQAGTVRRRPLTPTEAAGVNGRYRWIWEAV